MIKRILALAAAAALMLALLIPAHAEGAEMRVVGPETAPAVGESFTVSLELSGNPGFYASELSVSFDKTLLSCTALEPGEMLDRSMVADNLSADAGVRFASASADPTEDDGTFCTLTCTVLRPAVEYRIDISSASLFDENERLIPLTLSGAVIAGSGSEGASDDQGGDPSDGQDDGTSGGDDGSSPDGQDEGPGENDGSSDGQSEGPDDGQPDGSSGGQSGGSSGGQTDISADDQSGEASGGEETAADVHSFSDIEGHWGEDHIVRAALMGLFEGYPDGTFRPNAEVTRAQFVTVLWRMASKPLPAEPASFTDVAPGSWYEQAVSWAAEQGYVNGYPDGSFLPDAPVTRQEAMKILFYYHNGGVSGIEAMLWSIYDASFTDSALIGSWAKPAMYWAYYNELINGVTADTLSPGTSATRAQLAKILVNYSEQFEI